MNERQKGMKQVICMNLGVTKNVYSDDGYFIVRVDFMTRSDVISPGLCSDLVPKITCQVVQPGLISRLWLRTPASTLPTRFPAALDIGHGLPAA